MSAPCLGLPRAVWRAPPRRYRRQDTRHAPNARKARTDEGPPGRSHHRPWLALALAALLAALLAAGGPEDGHLPLRAADAPPAAPQETPSPADLPTAEALQGKIKEVEAATDLDEALRARILELYRLAASRLEEAQAIAARETSYRQAIETAPQETARIRDELKGEPSPPLALPPGLKASDLESQTVQAQAEAATLRNALRDLEAQIQAQGERPSKTQAERAAAQQVLDQIEQELATPVAPGENPSLTDARLVSLRARRHARTLEMRALEQEGVSYAVRLDLAKARRDRASRHIAVAEARLKSLQDALNEARRAEAEETRKEAERARTEAVGKHPLVRELAERNVDLGKELGRVTELIAWTGQEADSARDKRTHIEEERRSIGGRVGEVGLSDALGQLLRERRRGLADVRQYKSGALARQRDLADAGLREFRIEDDPLGKGPLAARVDELLQKRVEASTSPEDRHLVRAQSEELLGKQRELLSRLGKAYGDYRRELLRLDAEERLLVETSDEYAGFLDQNLLWIPNLPRVGEDTVDDLPAAVRWLASPQGWVAVGQTLVREALSGAVLTVLVLLATGVLLVAQRRLFRKLRSIGERVGKVYTDSFFLTVEVLAITGLMAAAWSLLAGYAGGLLLSAPDAPDFLRFDDAEARARVVDFVHAVGHGLRGTAILLWGLLAFRFLFATWGIGRAHFRWRERTVGLIRRNLDWLLPVMLPAMFLVTATGRETNPPETDSLGRLAFLAAMGALAVFVQRVLRPEAGLLERIIGDRRGSWLWNLRYVWYPAAVGTPIVLGGLAANGYYYSAIILTNRLLETVGIALGAVIAHDLVLRGFYVARARLALAKARERRDAAQTAGSGTFEGMEVALDTQSMDLTAISDQIRELLRAFIGISVVVGIWLVWEDVIPALGVLRKIRLWPHAVMVDGQEVLKAVTLADMALAIVVGIFTAIASKNLPALLEIAVLRHLPFDAGSRYAFVTLCRYLIATIGIVAALNAIGVGWAQVRWLLAAVGLGLGFGLQEIFANLVSGIMILFERPFRVGDVVTVGDLTGIVTKIRIRATTLLDWDRKELIVPNKTFITDRLINWTLSDQVTRLVLKVGVSYGSDATLAHGVMLETVKANPLVLGEPSPTVYFMGFGESSLDFEVRVFVRRIEDRLPVIHELHLALHRALGEAGIEIPFPQRDLHLRSVEGRSAEKPSSDGRSSGGGSARGRPAEGRPPDGAEPPPHGGGAG